MLLILLFIHTLSPGDASPGTQFILTPVNDVTCMSHIVLSMTSIGDDDVNVTARSPRLPDMGVIHATVSPGKWSTVTLSPDVRMKGFGFYDNGKLVIT